MNDNWMDPNRPIIGMRALNGGVNWHRVLSWVLVIALWAGFLALTWGWATGWKWVVRW